MSHPNWIGQTLGGRYKIDGMLGQGGMSAVYRCEDPNLHRTVAIKLIHNHLTGDPEFVRRFEAEAAAVAQLRHPNIIQVYDFNHDDNTYYMVLEFVPGETLQARLRQANLQGARMPVDEAVRVIAGVADAVDYAHRRGLIHRDIKPANIMLNSQGEPILMDFGIAKMLGGTQHTATGAVVGTATYISPEQVLGQRPTERSDIYSLGVTLYEMLAGRPPFEADSAMSLMMKHVNEAPPSIKALSPALPPALVGVVEKALAKNPDERFPTAAAMAAALRSVTTQPNQEPALASRATVIDELPSASVRSGPQGRHTGTHTGGHTGALTGTPVGPPPAPKIDTMPPPGSPAQPRRAMPVWALVGVPILAVICLVIGVTASLALMKNVLGTATPAPSEPAATGAPTEALATQVVATEALPTETVAAVEPSPTTAAVVATVPPGMVAAPAGTFQMGSTTGAADEQPVHAVTLPAFFIDTFEVTNVRYQGCVADGGCTPPAQTRSETRSAYFGNPEFNAFPVIGVTWAQAQAFCQWDGGKRLPTEAEWEYAATGGDGRRFPWGTDFDAGLVPTTARDTVAGNSFPGNASPFGALDMAGNVLEWVGDFYDSQFYGEAPAASPQGPATGSERVVRGGSFGNADAAVYTTTRRFHFAPDRAEIDIGLRCVLPAE